MTIQRFELIYLNIDKVNKAKNIALDYILKTPIKVNRTPIEVGVS